MVKFIQTCVDMEVYDRIARQAFEEKLTLGDLLEKAVIYYMNNKGQSREEDQDLTKRAGVNKT